MITKDQFIEILNFVKEKRAVWNKLQDDMEALSPGEYINFWPYFAYETVIFNLLDIMFGFRPETSPIQLFVIEGEFGAKKNYLQFEETLNGKTKTIDISTPTKLYNYCVKNAKLSRA